MGEGEEVFWETTLNDDRMCITMSRPLAAINSSQSITVTNLWFKINTSCVDGWQYMQIKFHDQTKKLNQTNSNLSSHIMMVKKVNGV